jgi:hypothetical protein
MSSFLTSLGLNRPKTTHFPTPPQTHSTDDLPDAIHGELPYVTNAKSSASPPKKSADAHQGQANNLAPLAQDELLLQKLQAVADEREKEEQK